MIKPTDLPSADWITGFIEGEGCFSIAIANYVDNRPRKGYWNCKRKKPALPLKVRPSFRINLAYTDIGALEKIRSFFGLGKIRVGRREKEKNWKPQAQFYVVAFSDLLKIKSFFEQQKFYAKKKQSFILWCEVLEMIMRKEHLTKEGVDKIIRIARKINNTGLCQKKYSYDRIWCAFW